eukprot:CAMPEP_0170619476 /NCGR_PEP_ID=MMETSP0224-20130122/27535_1 /TAXON_ID=285029 /ORGANISM="Togula jolla, Strain CCCM 725" /LENGTH=98 /DNA_ID=CAMNT_0010945565 /DNA_START=158 /DNA_END=454 /DNA_ORIENTATION=-
MAEDATRTQPGIIVFIGKYEGGTWPFYENRHDVHSTSHRSHDFHQAPRSGEYPGSQQDNHVGTFPNVVLQGLEVGKVLTVKEHGYRKVMACVSRILAD